MRIFLLAKKISIDPPCIHCLLQVLVVITDGVHTEGSADPKQAAQNFSLERKLGSLQDCIPRFAQSRLRGVDGSATPHGVLD